MANSIGAYQADATNDIGAYEAAAAGGDLDITATLVDVATADVDTVLNITRNLIASLESVASADIDTTIGLDRTITATLVDVATAALLAVTSDPNTPITLTGTLVTASVGDLAATVTFDKGLNPDAVSVIVARHAITLPGMGGVTITVRRRGGILGMLGRR